ncbi:MAG TPA: acetyl ornithine aminotransferase family protein [Nitrospiraceae bacterium]|nr:acetyl ornithine aminotransferase family protein [Nitrospiraceae bacterium]
MAKRQIVSKRNSRKDRMQKAPTIITPPPGPQAKAWVRRDERALSQSATRIYPLVVQKARGAVVEDVDGNRYLDFTAGIAVVATGHSHPKVLRAIRNQVARFVHMSGTDFYYPSQIKLAETIAKMAPVHRPARTFFSNSGAEAVEAAFKLARYHTRRPLMIAFQGAFHGRTMGALSLTGSKAVQRRHFAPLVPGVTHVPYPNCYRCPYGRTYPSCEMECVDAIRNVYFKSTVPPDDVAAIIVEPIQGEGGVIVPPPEFLPKLAALAKEFGILLIADEVQTGMGRTGKMFAVEHWRVKPDIMTIGKGIASGLPMGAMVASDEVMNWEAGSHANTFGGNPVACEAALATIDLLQQQLIANAAALGAYLLEELEQMKARHRLIGDVRGKGLMIGIECVRDHNTKEMAVAERNAIIQGCFKRGLLLLGCGQNVVRLVPPLIIAKRDADVAVEILDTVFSEVERRRP